MTAETTLLVDQSQETEPKSLTDYLYDVYEIFDKKDIRGLDNLIDFLKNSEDKQLYYPLKDCILKELRNISSLEDNREFILNVSDVFVHNSSSKVSSWIHQIKKLANVLCVWLEKTDDSIQISKVDIRTLPEYDLVYHCLKDNDFNSLQWLLNHLKDQWDIEWLERILLIFDSYFGRVCDILVYVSKSVNWEQPNYLWRFKSTNDMFTDFIWRFLDSDKSNIRRDFRPICEMFLNFYGYLKNLVIDMKTKSL